MLVGGYGQVLAYPFTKGVWNLGVGGTLLRFDVPVTLTIVVYYW